VPSHRASGRCRTLPVVSEKPSIAGTAVLALRASLEEIVGAETVARAARRLDPASRELLGSLTALTWVDELTVAALHDAVASEAGIDAERLFDQAVRAAAERSFKTVWRVLLRLSTDEALIARSQVLYSRSRSVSQVSARLVEPGHAELVLRGRPNGPSRTIRSLAISTEVLLRLTGRRQVVTVADERPGGGVVTVRWKP